MGNQTTRLPTIQTGGNQTTGLPTTQIGGAGSSLAPTISFPPVASYTEGFEKGVFPVEPWTTEGDGSWEITTERSNSGVYSIKSPTLNDGGLTSKTSSVTFTTAPDFGGGTFVFRVLAGVQMPIDDLLYFVDDVLVSQLTAAIEWETVSINLEPGEHKVRFDYKYNPIGLEQLPPASPDHIGAAFIDDVFIIPAAGPIPDGDLSIPPSPSVVGSGMPVCNPFFRVYIFCTHA